MSRTYRGFDNQELFLETLRNNSHLTQRISSDLSAFSLTNGNLKLFNDLIDSTTEVQGMKKTLDTISRILDEYKTIIPYYFIVLLDQEGKWKHVCSSRKDMPIPSGVLHVSELKFIDDQIVFPVKIGEDYIFALAALTTIPHESEVFKKLLAHFLSSLLLKTKVIEATRDALVGRDEFISLASHELKTPLTALKLRLEITKRKRDLPKEFKDCLESAEEQTDRINALVDDLLDVSRIDTGRLHYQFVDLNAKELINKILLRHKDQIHKAGNIINLNLSEDLEVCWCGNRMDQVFTNLLTNALRYAPGSEIDIDISCRGDVVKIIFADNGPGIPSDRQETIYDRYVRAETTTKGPGLGLGLYLVKEIINHHHGTIKLDSIPGKGTTFTILLPRVVIE